MSQSHFPPSFGQQTRNHHLDSNILSISHSPPEVTIGPTDFTHGGSQRKFTLLSRPQQQLPGNPSLSPYQHPLTSAEHLNSASILNQQSVIQPPPGSVQGRAARGEHSGIGTDDYYDTEDPSVNLQEFIVNSMQAQKNRVVLMKLEEEFVNYVSNPSRTEPLKLPSWDSYHRMLAHRVAAYFGLEHNVDPADKTRVLVGKGPNTRMPKIRFGDYMSLSDDPESVEPKLILKRTSKDSTPMDKFEAALASVEPPSSDVKMLKSYEQREEEYEKARAQIFSQQSPLPNTRSVLPFDLATKSNQRMSSSIFPSSMHHRRAASDTSMFKRVATADFKKDASSNHSSRSATPLVNSLLRLGGSCELLSSSVNSRVQPPMQVQTSPKAAQQQLHSSVLESPVGGTSQSIQYHSQQQQQQVPPSSSSSASDSLSKYDNHVHHTGTSQYVATAAAPGVPALHYQHLQPNQPHLPVVYPQPPAAVMADPNWYPYQQMMLYQLSPQGYVPTPHYLSGGIPGAVYHPYSVTPVTTPPQQIPHPGAVSALTRLPIGVEQLASPVHPNSGVSLVRPVPQQASPVRFGKVDAAWNFSPTHQFNVQQSLMAQQLAVSQSSAQPAFAAVPPHLTASHLAEHLDSSLHISNPGGGDSGGLENDMDPREAASNKFAKVKAGSYPETSSAEEPTSGYVGHVVQRLPGSAPFHVGNMPLSNVGDPAMYSGQMISPTHPQGPLQYMHHHMQPPPPPVFGAGGQDTSGYINTQTVLPTSTIHFPPGSHSQPSTPTMGPLSLAPPGILQAQQQGIYSPPSTGITQSPVQILGHTLGTSLFSPPPSSGNQHGLFVNSPTSSGKVGFSPGVPNHPPVGSARFRHFESPKQSSGHISEVQSSLTQPGLQSLPPRLAQQHGQKGGNRYQNQRHPSIRASVKANNHSGTTGPVTLGDHMPSQFVSAGGSTTPKREPLLPTPPSTQMVKLDTNLTCGVPVHVMEVVGCPVEGAPERAPAIKAVTGLTGLLDVKTGKMAKTGEEVVVAVFSDEESAMQALKMKHSDFTLSIPRNNHAKFILNMLQLQ